MHKPFFNNNNNAGIKCLNRFLPSKMRIHNGQPVFWLIYLLIAETGKSCIVRMWMLLWFVIGRSTIKSIDTSSIGFLGNSRSPNRPFFLFSAFTMIHTLQFLIYSRMFANILGHQGSSNILWCVLKAPKCPE